MEENRLISMVDFVLGQPSEIQNRITSFESIHFYAVFLETHLNIGQFVPAVFDGGKWVVLEMPHEFEADIIEIEQYQQAKDNVIFEGDWTHSIDDRYTYMNWFKNGIITIPFHDVKTIQDLIKYKPTLTTKGLKDSGLWNGKK